MYQNILSLNMLSLLAGNISYSFLFLLVNKNALSPLSFMQLLDQRNCFEYFLYSDHWIDFFLKLKMFNTVKFANLVLFCILLFDAVAAHIC